LIAFLLPSIITVTFQGNGLLIVFLVSGIVAMTLPGNGVCILFGWIGLCVTLLFVDLLTTFPSRKIQLI